MHFALVVMWWLVRNFIVDDYKIVNGAIGIVRDIVYKEFDGPHHPTGELPAYIVVEFPHSCIPEDKHLIPDKMLNLFQYLL